MSSGSAGRRGATIDMFGDGGGGSDAPKPGGFSINQDYAQRHTHNKRREEKQRLEEKYGPGATEGDVTSSDSESEDEDAEGHNPIIEQDFLVTLGKLKSNDPDIYDSSKKLYRDPIPEPAEGEAAASATSKKTKPMYLKDHERRRLETKGAMAFVSDDEDEDEGGPKKPLPFQSKFAFDEEQRDLRKGLMAALHGDGDGDDDEGDGDGGSGDDDEKGGLFTKRTKTRDELRDEEDDYKGWLKSEDGAAAVLRDKQAAKEMEPLKRFWTSKDLTEKDQFLRDYITGRKWRFDEDATPTYNEVTGPGGTMGPGSGGGGVIDLEDEINVEEAEQYERKYNFRFEEDGAAEIKTYPRAQKIQNSVRAENSKRKTARERAKERKDLERQQKTEEIARLKKIKQAEIAEKLAEIKQITGTDVREFGAIGDLEAEFDPDAHDQGADAMFNEDFYAAGGSDEEKPEFPDDLGDIDVEYGDEEYDDADEHWPDADDGAFPDADAAEYGGVTAVQTKKPKISKAQLKKIEAAVETGELDQEFDKDPALRKYLDEYHNLDFEDIVGGIPTRFKYREVLPNDYGLTTDEVMHADDKELNSWAPLKRLIKYRGESDERSDRRLYKKYRGAMTKKKTTFANTDAWKYGVKAEEWEARDAARRETKEAERKKRTIAKREKKKKRKAEDAVDDDDSGSAATAAAAASVEDGDSASAAKKAKKNHRERRKAERAAKFAAEQAGLPIPATGGAAAVDAGSAGGSDSDAAEDGEGGEDGVKQKKMRKKSSKEAAERRKRTAEAEEEKRVKSEKKKKEKAKAKRDAKKLSSARLAAYGAAGKVVKSTDAPVIDPSRKKKKKKKKKTSDEAN